MAGRVNNFLMELYQQAHKVKSKKEEKIWAQLGVVWPKTNNTFYDMTGRKVDKHTNAKKKL